MQKNLNAFTPAELIQRLANAMKTGATCGGHENNTSKPKDSPKQDAGEVRDQGSAPSTNSAEERKLPNE